MLLASSLHAQVNDSTRQLARDIFKQLIEINTTDSVGSVTAAAQAMAQRFRDAGFPDSDIHLLGPNDRKQNLVVRLHGTGAHKPILLMGHLDVVEARREDWTIDPFQFVEKDGYFYGRGTQDMKSSDAVFVAVLIRFKQEGYRPDRDIILMLTADEEGGKSDGVDWLVRNHRELIDAEVGLNGDGGGIASEHGKPLIFEVDASEKLYADYQFEVTNPGGHSSLPTAENAIYHLADALKRLQSYQFPFELNAVTRAYFESMSQVQTGQAAAAMKAILKTPPDRAAITRLSADPLYNAIMRTTCVATMLQGGHAQNALPQRATANVNCRILPGHSPEEVRQELVEVVADRKVQVGFVVPHDGKAVGKAPDDVPPVPPAPLAFVMAPMKAMVAQMWPGLPVVPSMDTGASDDVFTDAAGIPSYEFSGFAIDSDDVRAHGKDERLGVKSFNDGLDFYYRFLKRLTAQK
jgi:acetylornithine deacetylase/succinyl-diaminopimelate desuccinylase-like protein